MFEVLVVDSAQAKSEHQNYIPVSNVKFTLCNIIASSTDRCSVLEDLVRGCRGLQQLSLRSPVPTVIVVSFLHCVAATSIAALFSVFSSFFR